MDFLNEIVKEIGDDYTKLAKDIDDTETYVDTGSYIFNGLVQVAYLVVYLGIRLLPLLASLLLARLSFLSLSSKTFLILILTDIAFILTLRQQLINLFSTSRGIDLSRLVVVNVVTVEQFRSKALKAVDMYLKKSEDERKPCMFVLDSLGMLSTEKEITDALNEKQVRDMTKSQLIKGAFRMLTLKLGQAKIPMIVTNHTYDVIGSYVPTKEMGGGSGLKYAASVPLFISAKRKKRMEQKSLEILSRQRLLSRV